MAYKVKKVLCDAFSKEIVILTLLDLKQHLIDVFGREDDSLRELLPNSGDRKIVSDAADKLFQNKQKSTTVTLSDKTLVRIDLG